MCGHHGHDAAFNNYKPWDDWAQEEIGTPDKRILLCEVMPKLMSIRVE